MAVWKDLVIVLLSTKVLVFHKPSASGTDSAMEIQPVATLAIPELRGPVHDAHFVDLISSVNRLIRQTHPGGKQQLLIYVRVTSQIYALLLTADVVGHCEKKFKLQRYGNIAEPSLLHGAVGVDAPRRTQYPIRFAVGPGNAYMLWQTTTAARSFTEQIPVLHLTSLQAAELGRHYPFGQTGVIARKPMPLPFFTTCIEFDDARGVLLTGTSEGDLFLNHFIDQGILTAGGLLDDLPVMKKLETNLDQV